MSTLKTNNIQHVDRSDPSIIINTDGSVNIAGTMTYEDVTNVDAVGIITGRNNIDAQKQVLVGTGVSVKAGGLNVTAGISTFGGDVNIADKIVHTGDTNTAIRFPSADTFTVETAGAERIRVSDGGRVLIGHTASINVDVHHAALQVNGDTYNESTISIISNSSDTNGAYLFFAKQRSGSAGGTTIVQDGDTLGQIRFLGMDGTDYDNPAASIEVNCDGTPGSNDIPGRIKFSTGDGGSLTERVRIDSSGQMGVGMTPTRMFEVKDSTGANRIANIRGTGASGAYLAFLDQNTTDDSKCRVGSAGGNNLVMRGDTVQFATGAGAEFGRFDSSGRLLIGTQTEGFATADNFTISDTSTDCGMTIRAGTSSQSIIAFSDANSGTGEYAGYLSYYHSTDELHIGAVSKPIVKIHNEYFNILADEGTTRMNFGFTDTNGGELSIYDDTGSQKLRICGSTNTNHFFNNGGDLLVGTTSDAGLASFGTNTGGILVDNAGSSNTAVGVSHDTSEIFIGADTDTGYIWQASNHRIQIATNDTRRIIITAGGQMGLGEVTETAIRNNGAGNKTYLVISKGNGSGNAPNTYNADEEYLHFGGREWGTVNNSKYGHYYMGFGYTNGVTGDHSPCAIGFYETTTSGYTKGNFTIRTRAYTNSGSTTSDRLVVQSNGNVTTVEGGYSNRNDAGFTARKGDSVTMTRASGTPIEVNRTGNDGALIYFYQDNSSEGNISVSGSTVSYNGGHLSRWSQLQGISTTDKSARPTIYQGTVMSNLDELCSWERAAVLYTEEEKEDGVIPEGKDVGDIKHAAYTEDNQQLNMTKVSDVEGDKDVAGVFWTWDDEDDEIVNDFYIAMTGDMVIRVAGSTTVQRGDLLISAGDGTAKPQVDDIIRSSTIAKIISTNHTATYADGSKAYPCVLMAC